MILMTWLLMKKENRDRSLLTCALYLFENVMHQPLNRAIVPRSFSGRVIMAIFAIYNLALNLMYMSIITSLLISGSKPPQINTLADLNKEEYKDVRILMRKQGYIWAFMKSANMLSGFEDRVDFFDTADRYKPYIIESMINGSHVFITTTISDNICNTNKDANKTAAKLQDVRKSRQCFSFPYIPIHRIALGT